MYRFVSFCFFMIVSTQVYGVEKGSLIVSYQTDAEADRLNRVRFWVKDSQDKQSFFPKENGFIEHSEDNTRMVVIEDLNPGVYTVEFLIPNRDNRFKTVPIREIEVTQGGVARLDQRIKARKIKEEKIAKIETGSLIVFYDTGERQDLLENVRFSLTDEEGNSLIYPIEGELVEEPLTGGLSFTLETLPTGMYSLNFFLADSDESVNQETINFEIPSGKTETIHKSLSINSENSVSSEKETVPTEVGSVAS